MLKRSLLFRLIALAPSALLCTFTSAPAFANSCVSGNLSTLIGTTCDIGSLEFNFQSWSSYNFTAYGDGSYSFNVTPQPSDFAFTANGSGFTLSGSAVSITAPLSGTVTGYQQVYARLDYTVTDLGGNITGETEADNGLFANGSTYSDAQAEGVTYDSGSDEVYGSDEIHNGSPSGGPNVIGNPFSSGTGFVYLFSLYSWNGDSSGWNGETSISYTTANTITNTPEPSSMLALAMLVLVLLAGKRHFSRARA